MSEGGNGMRIKICRQIINLKNFPKINQLEGHFCIPACIENILKFCGEKSYNQYQLYNFFVSTKKLNSEPYLDVYSKIVNNSIANFKADYVVHEGKSENLISYIQKMIKKNIPVIFTFKVFIKGKERAHVVIAIGYDQNRICYYNTSKYIDFDEIPYIKLDEKLKGGKFDTLIVIPE